MSLLNHLFNKGLLGAKCKTCLTLTISRIKLLQNKRDVQLKLMRKEIAQFLQAGQEAIARIRVEHVIREQNIWAAYEILELFCEFVLARVPILESQRDCPSELQEAVASIIFAAPKCSYLPDLLQIRNLFATKYGKEFILAASELWPDSGVNRTIIEKLSVSAPSVQMKLNVMKEIVKEYNVKWDSSKTEAEFSKKPEDLLDGPKQISRGAALSQVPSRQDTRERPSNDTPPIMSTNSKHGVKCLQSSSNKSLFGPDGTESSIKNHIVGPVSDSKKETRSQSCDVLERAQAAITAAKRASAAARAAAELVNVKLSSWKLEERKI